MIIFTGFILVHVVTAGQSQEELCATVTKINCNIQYSAEPNEIVCGNDGNTYSNRFGSCLFYIILIHWKMLIKQTHGSD